MPKYTPIALKQPIRSSVSNLLDLRLRNETMDADFAIPGDAANSLHVHFDRALIIRVLDEMPLCTEHEETPNQGLVPDHFAYMVEGASFWLSQSRAFKMNYPEARHYRLITGWTCVDVIYDREPEFSTVPRGSRGYLYSSCNSPSTLDPGHNFSYGIFESASSGVPLSSCRSATDSSTYNNPVSTSPLP